MTTTKTPETLEELVAKWGLLDGHGQGPYPAVYGPGKGWLPLLDELCGALVSMGWDRRVAQIKEKFGGLRFYLPHEKHNEELLELIWSFEERSMSTCEHCGAPGRMNKSRPWIRTLCEPCSEQWSKHDDALLP
jgi:hypothetical protein